MEEYKILKFNNNYQVSNFGNVQNIKTKKILKKYYNKKYNYFYVMLNNPNILTFKKEIHKVNYLVVSTFICDLRYVSAIFYKDNNTQNNYIDNLEVIKHDIISENPFCILLKF
jgi:hypothetical protein